MYFTVVTAPGYDVTVNRFPVVVGNNAVLSCTARDEVKEHLKVASWYRDEAILLPGNTDTGKYFFYFTTKIIYTLKKIFKFIPHFLIIFSTSFNKIQGN